MPSEPKMKLPTSSTGMPHHTNVYGRNASGTSRWIDAMAAKNQNTRRFRARAAGVGAGGRRAGVAAGWRSGTGGAGAGTVLTELFLGAEKRDGCGSRCIQTE